MPRRSDGKHVRSECGRSGSAGHARFCYPASFYMDAYRSHRAASAVLDPTVLKSEPDRAAALVNLAERGTRVRWAMASRGTESIPFVLQMVRSSDPQERGDAKEVLALMGADARVVDSLIALLGDAPDSDTLTALVVALGATESARAVPAIARLLQLPGLDSATRAAATASLGALTDKNFESSDDPDASLASWLQANGYGPVAYALRCPRVSPGKASAPTGRARTATG